MYNVSKLMCVSLVSCGRGNRGEGDDDDDKVIKVVVDVIVVIIITMINKWGDGDDYHSEVCVEEEIVIAKWKDWW